MLEPEDNWNIFWGVVVALRLEKCVARRSLIQV